MRGRVDQVYIQKRISLLVAFDLSNQQESRKYYKPVEIKDFENTL